MRFFLSALKQRCHHRCAAADCRCPCPSLMPSLTSIQQVATVRRTSTKIAAGVATDRRTFTGIRKTRWGRRGRGCRRMCRGRRRRWLRTRRKTRRRVCGKGCRSTHWRRRGRLCHRMTRWRRRRWVRACRKTRRRICGKGCRSTRWR